MTAARLRQAGNIARHALPAVLSIVLLAACAGQGEKADTISRPVWPEPPARARVVYLQSFSTPEELGIERGLWQWVGDFVFGADDNRLIRPMAVVSTDDRHIFVADPGVRGIHRFDAQDNTYRLIRGENGLELPSPVAMAADGRGNVYVTDSRLAQVFVIRGDSAFAQPLAVDTELDQPTGIAVAPGSGNIYLVDTGRHEVLVLDRNGDLITRFGRQGVKPGEFNYPTLIWAQNGTLYVTDALNFRIQLFDLEGNYISSFGRAGQASGYQARPKGIATDREGNIYVVDSLLNNIQLFDASGRYLMTIGELGQLPGQFWLPTGIYISPQQKIYVADSHNHRVQVFQYIGDSGADPGSGRGGGL